MAVLGEECFVVSIPYPYTAHSTQRCLVDAENIHVVSHNDLRDAIVGLDHAPRCGSDKCNGVSKFVGHMRNNCGDWDTFYWPRSMGTFALPSALRSAISRPLPLAGHRCLFRQPRFRHCPRRSAPLPSWPVASHSDLLCSPRWTALVHLRRRSWSWCPR